MKYAIQAARVARRPQSGSPRATRAGRSPRPRRTRGLERGTNLRPRYLRQPARPPRIARQPPSRERGRPAAGCRRRGVAKGGACPPSHDPHGGRAPRRGAPERAGPHNANGGEPGRRGRAKRPASAAATGERPRLMPAGERKRRRHHTTGRARAPAARKEGPAGAQREGHCTEAQASRGRPRARRRGRSPHKKCGVAAAALPRRAPCPRA